MHQVRQSQGKQAHPTRAELHSQTGEREPKTSGSHLGFSAQAAPKYTTSVLNAWATNTKKAGKCCLPESIKTHCPAVKNPLEEKEADSNLFCPLLAAFWGLLKARPKLQFILVLQEHWLHSQKLSLSIWCPGVRSGIPRSNSSGFQI